MHLVLGETFADSHTHTNKQTPALQIHSNSISRLYLTFTVLLQKSSNTNPSDSPWQSTQTDITGYANISQPAHTLRFSERIHSKLAFTYISVLRSQRFSFLHPLGEHDLTVCDIQPYFSPPTDNMPYSDVNPTARQ